MDDLYKKLEAFLLSFGRDVTCNPTQDYIGFWHNADRRRVFAYVHVEVSFIGIEVRPGFDIQPGFVVPDSSKVTCRRIILHGTADFARAKPFLRKCYRFRGRRCDPPPSG